MFWLLAAITLSKPGTAHVAAPTTVIVQPAEPHTDTLLVAVTAFLVLVTAALAWFTRNLHLDTKNLAKETHKLAKETVAASKIADQHHQETLAPFIVLKPAFWKTDVGQDYPTVKCEIENQGGGAAVHVMVSVRAIRIPEHPNAQPPEAPVFLGGEHYDSAGPIAAGKSPARTTDFQLRELAGQLNVNLRVRIDFVSTFNTEGWTVWEVTRNQGSKMVGFQTCKVAERVTTATTEA